MNESRSMRSSVWNPLRQRLFRLLWIAAVASNIGTWMHEVAAAWLMTSLTPSPAVVALIQTATTFPIFILALPSGALADLVDRRWLLLLTQGWMLGAAFLLGLLTLYGATTPWLLLVFTFAIGLGAAVNAPAWNAIMPELVSWPELPAAIALSSVSFNLARAVGPALGGVVVAGLGPGPVFLINAASFLGVLIVLYSWKREPRESVLPAERMLGAIRTGLRYVRHDPALHAVLVRAAIFTICGSAIWALLPVLARVELGLEAAEYGVLVGFLGAGAVLGGIILPRFQQAVPIDWLTGGSTVLYALTTGSLAYFTSLLPLCGAMFLGGIAWTTLLSTLNVVVQTLVPAWVRARVLSVYILVFFGFYAGSSAWWGGIASRAGVRSSLAYAALGLMVGLLAIIRFPLRSIGQANLEPSMHWPSPMVVKEPQPEQGPVLVTIEYRIDPKQTDQFTRAMKAVQRIRLRDGAMRWGLFVDAAAEGRYVEVYLIESWVEHLRQHERITIADRDIEKAARAFHIGEKPPEVSHFIYAADNIP